VAGELTIPERFNGPPGSGQGGYTSGRLAALLGLAGGPAAVSLRRPPPLGRPLRVEARDDALALLDGEDLVAAAQPAPVDVEPPAAPTLEQARTVEPAYGEMAEHPFPTCFGCGPDRPAGDGLHVFAGPVPGRDLIACEWVPRDADPAFAWAALDCPTGHVCATGRPALLARLAVRIDAPIELGRAHVVSAWRLGREGRKHRSAGALYDETGRPLAVSEALWIELKA
jgi:hypothetical protein